MPYKIHPADRHSLSIQLSDLLHQIPLETLPGMIAEAQNRQRAAEFGHPNLRRNCDADDHYWFEHLLIKRAEALIVAGKPQQAWSDCLTQHNHGHSGWVDQTDRVYRCPSNQVEQQVSDDLRAMIIKVAEALIASNPPSLSKGILGAGSMSMIGLYECLCLLGADVPEHLLNQCKTVMVDYLAADPANEDCAQIEQRFANRFKT